MNNRNITLLLVISILLVQCSPPMAEQYDDLVFGPIPQRLFDSSVFPDRIVQTLSTQPATQININWRTSPDVATGYVEYAPFSHTIKEGFVPETVLAEVKPLRYQHVHDNYFSAQVQELSPNTTYMLRVGNDEYRSEWFHVRTAPESMQSFRFLHFGDVNQHTKEYGTRVFRQAATQYSNARFMIHTGNMVSENGDDDNWGEWFHAGGWLFQETPSVPVTGNGEFISVQQRPVKKSMLYPQWDRMFRLPQNGPGGLEGVSYFIDYPGVRVVSVLSHFESIRNGEAEVYLNNEELFTREMFNDQLIWLRNVLAGNKQPWLVVAMNMPVFSANRIRDDELLQEHFIPLLEKYNVDLVLQGNEYVYARGINPDQERKDKPPVYVVSVAGGGMQQAERNQPWIKRAVNNTQLFQVVTISQSNMRLQSVDIRGRIHDQVNISRSGSGAKRVLN